MLKRSLRSTVLACLCLLIVWSVGPVAIAGDINLTITRSDLDGGGIVDLVSGMEYPARGLALDTQDGRMYWTIAGEGGASQELDGSVNRVRLNGTMIQTIVTGLRGGAGIAVDPSAGKVYWADDAGGKIQRANLDGSDVEDLVIVVGVIRAMALDLQNQKMYWTNVHDVIQRANLDGSNVEALVHESNQFGRGIALDIAAGKVYWTQFSKKIRRANLDGTDVEDLITVPEFPEGIALDIGAGKMYYAVQGVGIERANLDGSNVEHVLSRAANRVALDPEQGHIYFSSAIDTSVVPALSPTATAIAVVVFLALATTVLVRRRTRVSS